MYSMIVRTKYRTNSRGDKSIDTFLGLPRYMQKGRETRLLTVLSGWLCSRQRWVLESHCVQDECENLPR